MTCCCAFYLGPVGNNTHPKLFKTTAELRTYIVFMKIFFFINKEVKFKKSDMLEEKVSEVLDSNPNSVITGL